LRQQRLTLGAGNLARYDADLIASDHNGIDDAVLVSHAKPVIDTRNVCQRSGITAANVVKA
jgi:UDP-N-acetyl-D-glucosamine dehydrogenase